MTLPELIDQAEKEGKWLYCPYQSMWFSPQQLREENAKGYFLWGPVNWRLRDPKEKVAALEREVDLAIRTLEQFKKTITP